MDKKIKIFLKIVVLLVVAGAAFYGGMLYKASQTPARRLGAGTGAAAGRFATGNNFITGNIIAMDSQSITVKDRTGNSRIIFYSPSTEVGKFVSGSVTDMSVGQSVMASGKTNSDGSITAQSIQIRPAMPAGSPTGSAQQNPNSTATSGQ